MNTELMFSTEEEIFIFACAILLGAFFGAVYNLLQVVRAVFPHNKILIFAEDFLYMLFCSLCFFVFSMELVGGTLRGYVLAGNVVGFFAFYLTAGRVVVFVAKNVVKLIKKCLIHPLKRLFVDPILRLFSKIYTKTINRFVQFCKRFEKSKKSRKNHLQVDNGVVYNKNVKLD